MTFTAGCYSLNILCNNNHRRDSSLGEYNLAREVTFTGQTLADCKRAARMRGWKFVKGGKHYCPSCAKADRT